MASLKLTVPQRAVEAEVVTPLQGQPIFVNLEVEQAYNERLQAAHDEMVLVPGLSVVTKQAVERSIFFYFKMRDLERSGVLDPSRAGSMKVMIGVYEKLLAGWVKTNEELHKAIRKVDPDSAFKQALLGQVSGILRKHISDPVLLQRISDELMGK